MARLDAVIAIGAPIPVLELRDDDQRRKRHWTSANMLRTLASCACRVPGSDASKARTRGRGRQSWPRLPNRWPVAPPCSVECVPIPDLSAVRRHCRDGSDVGEEECAGRRRVRYAGQGAAISFSIARSSGTMPPGLSPSASFVGGASTIWRSSVSKIRGREGKWASGR